MRKNYLKKNFKVFRVTHNSYLRDTEYSVHYNEIFREHFSSNITPHHNTLIIQNMEEFLFI